MSFGSLLDELSFQFNLDAFLYKLVVRIFPPTFLRDQLFLHQNTIINELLYHICPCALKYPTENRFLSTIIWLLEVFNSYGDKWASLQLRDRTAKDRDQNPLHFNLCISNNKAAVLKNVTQLCKGKLEGHWGCRHSINMFLHSSLSPALSGKMSRSFSHRDEPCHFMMENTKQILLARALFMPAVILLLRARCAEF